MGDGRCRDARIRTWNDRFGDGSDTISLHPYSLILAEWGQKRGKLFKVGRLFVGGMLFTAITILGKPNLVRGIDFALLGQIVLGLTDRTDQSK